MLFVLLLLHAVCGTAVLIAGRRLGRGAWLVGAVAPAAVVVWLVANSGRVVGGSGVSSRAEWVSALGLALDLRVDPFAALMIVLVSGIGVLMYAYAWY